ncbi:uncharacterized protein TRIADDRAFT_59775 [Trichoplax adhaerens]|uniref:FZ domain-containing protein n=1 Tax=Trichoplax adhaerens TaxID=10228 RepID=B3S6E3_TRIAD|nr:predicted protein [Trichoplax adhaerens]EDV21606.1 predicted protein [Trichoplax adhaerens]|eukprot:XP_002115754.1 predicted protein [Trichoplax adhaerens]
MKIIRVSLWLPLLTVLGLSDHISAMFHGGDIIHDGQSNSANTDMVHRVTPVRQPTKVVHDVKIRSADKVYLYSKINSCTRPNASVLATCGIDYRVPTTVLFHNILQVKNYLAQMARRNMIVYNSKCASIVTKIKCKTLLPRCSEDYTTVYLNDIQEECNQAAIWCQNATNFPHVNICKQNRSVYSFNQCIKPPLSFDNPSLCNQPMLPSYSTIPQWLLPNLKLSSSRLNENLRLLLSLNGAKNGCIDKTIMTMCQSIPHCSTDGTHLLTTLSESQCEATVKW